MQKNPQHQKRFDILVFTEVRGKIYKALTQKQAA
jgi:hypothetical protein